MTLAPLNTIISASHTQHAPTDAFRAFDTTKESENAGREQVWIVG